jgi:hypothetical protein
MSRQSRAGKREWQTRQGTYQQELTEQITARAGSTWHAWQQAGHLPMWMQVKMRLRRRQLTRTGSDDAERG